MIKIIDRQIIPSKATTRYMDLNDVSQLLQDELLLINICGALVVLRPKSPEPVVYTQGVNESNRYLHAPHAREASSFLTKHNLRSNVSIAATYKEICQKNTFNILKCAAASTITNGGSA